jgi:adenylate cyclase
MPLDALSGEVRRLERAAWIVLTAAFAAVLGAWVMGYALERPILRLAQATAAIRNLGLATEVSIEGVCARLRVLAGAAFLLCASSIRAVR